MNNPAITVLGVLAAFVLFMGLVFGLVLAMFGLRVATAGLFGAGEAHIQTQGADFRLAAYNHFFDACAGIQGQEGQLDALFAERDQFEPGTRDYGYTIKSITGVQGARAQAIAQYNQDALKWTIGQFRDSDLPFQLPVNVPYEGEEDKTTCAFDY